jgi:hypothetical protein
MAYYYLLPVFDMGVKIDSYQGTIRSIEGRVTTIMPPEACLSCRNRIQADAINNEVELATNPELAEKRREEGYAPELPDPDPAVIPFTSAIASSAISEFLHRITGFMGTERTSSEVLYFYDQGRVRTNRRAQASDCFCANRDKWGRGDERKLLGAIWREENS